MNGKMKGHTDKQKGRITIDLPPFSKSADKIYICVYIYVLYFLIPKSQNYNIFCLHYALHSLKKCNDKSCRNLPLISSCEVYYSKIKDLQCSPNIKVPTLTMNNAPSQCDTTSLSFLFNCNVDHASDSMMTLT